MWCHFNQVTNNSTNMSKHVALQGAHVHQTTLCVTFGAPHVRTHFRCLCTSWSDLWTCTPPKPPNYARTCLYGNLLGTQFPHGCHPDPTSARLRQHPNLQFVISTVGGSAMHMERPDDIGREAGIGGTRNGKELNVFRACP